MYCLLLSHKRTRLSGCYASTPRFDLRFRVSFFLYLCRRLAAEGILHLGCPCVMVPMCDHLLNLREHFVLQTACGNFTRFTTSVQLGQRWNDKILRSEGQRSGSRWSWVRSHQTHYRSHRGRVFTGQMTQATVSKHWRKIGSEGLGFSTIRSTPPHVQ